MNVYKFAGAVLLSVLLWSCGLSVEAAKPGGGGGSSGGGGGGGHTPTGKSLTYSLVFGGFSRTYILRTPPNYDRRGIYPLVIVYHGRDGTGTGIETKSGFDAVSDAQGFIVAYPYAKNGDWAPIGINNDVDFTKALIQAIEGKYSIDPSRIYAAGLSQGGNFSMILGCLMPDWIAGFANVTGALSTTVANQCFPSRPITAVFFHGTADPVIPYEGGTTLTGDTVYSAQQTAEFWAGANTCPDTADTQSFPDTLSDGSPVTDGIESWNPCAAGATVAFYTIENGGHTWPGTTDTSTEGGSSQVGPVSTGVHASEIIWQILGAARLSPAP